MCRFVKEEEEVRVGAGAFKRRCATLPGPMGDRTMSVSANSSGP